MKMPTMFSDELPFVFCHQYGRLTVWATTKVEAELKAKRFSGGLPVVYQSNPGTFVSGLAAS